MPEVRDKIDSQLDRFSSFKDLSNDEWFSEMCFCLLTSNSKAITAMKIQDALGAHGFKHHPSDTIRETIIANKHRFHNVKTGYIVSAREHLNIKDILMPLVAEGGSSAAREWLVANIKGFSYKESSHFLRNVGFFDLAILDRHILNLMLEHGIIDEKPATLNRKRYLAMENVFKGLSDELGISCAELDFYMWYMRTGQVLK